MWIYKNTKDNKARFILGEEGENLLVCFGVNASTAEPENLDPTLTIVRNRSKENSFSGWVMLNLYPQRATNPSDMHQELDKVIHKKNLDSIKQVFNKRSDVVVWAAWGGLINERLINDNYYFFSTTIKTPFIETKEKGERELSGRQNPLRLSIYESI